jgi:two-component system, OmpR family, phosphate regulon sensor histidine kinase PhoR
MALMPDMARQMLEALGEPALIIRDSRTIAANRPARDLLGQAIEGSDVRLALRHPDAVQMLLSGNEGDLELVGIGSLERPWLLSARALGDRHLLVRLIDRSVVRSAERMRTDFVANASHELRTPLATVIGYAETLAEEGPVADEVRARFGATIETEARRMQRIVEDLMSLSRIEADRYRLPDERVDLGEVARIAVKQASPLAERRGCRIESDIADGLPAVAGDFGQLLQVADNLIGNAIRYGCSEQSPVIVVSVQSSASRVTLTVSDRGEGITPEHLPRLTERFYRVDSARSRESGGTGLGLAIVKHIAERHRGTLDIRSAPGRGTEVSVSIPMA